MADASPGRPPRAARAAGRILLAMGVITLIEAGSGLVTLPLEYGREALGAAVLLFTFIALVASAQIKVGRDLTRSWPRSLTLAATCAALFAASSIFAFANALRFFRRGEVGVAFPVVAACHVLVYLTALGLLHLAVRRRRVTATKPR